MYGYPSRPAVAGEVVDRQRCAMEGVVMQQRPTSSFAGLRVLITGHTGFKGSWLALWTQSLSRAHRLAAEVEAGQVFVNTYGAGGGVELPFGGFKKSGYGREKSMEALDEYTQTKTVVIKL